MGAQLIKVGLNAMKLYRKLDSLMDSDDLQEEMVSATGGKRLRALSASPAGSSRGNPRLKVARLVSLCVMSINRWHSSFVWSLGDPSESGWWGVLPGSYRGSGGGRSPVRCRAPLNGRLEKRMG